MKLIAGLGNPGKRYAESRHNVGFLVVAELAQRWELGPARHDRHCEALVVEGQSGDERVLLVQPQTYMNLSGRSVAAAWRYYQLELADLMVVFDDLDLPVGHLRLRAQGSAGGHHGMSDVIRHVGSDQFPRLRIGIGRVHPSATVEYVLGRFSPDERAAIQAAVGRGADALECWLRGGIEAAMNQFNTKPARDGRAPQPPAEESAKGDES